ncbi:MAG: L-threonylcarbamoyladenylate synthase [Nocardiopsaceae bacterium]|nr:L-threonylcarbamoyladenylate synthase [Nocardiopsaceae bacterium]
MTAPVRTASPAAVEQAAAVLRDGGLVISPTATNYNLICDARDAGAVARVFAAKRRVKLGPLPVSLPYPSGIPEFVSIPEAFDSRAFDELLPGEVSFIFWQKYPFPDQLTCGLRTVAVSCTSHPVFRSIVVATGGPVAATSANISGQGNVFVDLGKAIADLGDEVDLIIDAGPTEADAHPEHAHRVNTIVDLTFDPPQLCRRGWVPTEKIIPFVPGLVDDPDAYKKLVAQRAQGLTSTGPASTGPATAG